jgi:phospholipase/carboxylesterase
MMEKHGAVLRKKGEKLREAMGDYLTDAPGEEDCRAGEALLEASRLVSEGVSRFTAPGGLQEGVINALRAGRKVCRAYEILFDLRHEIRAVDGFFREGPGAPIEGDRIVHLGQPHDTYARGSASLYVPGGDEGLKPLILALHGGYGHGRDFFWTWMGQARSRGLFLLAPTSTGTTWSIVDPEADLVPLLDLVAGLGREYPIDPGRILLTGFSDGATFCLACAMQAQGSFSAFNPVSGVLPPGDLSCVRARRIFWIHGAYDWMFPVSRARWGSEALSRAGADVRLKVLEDLAHAFPKEENPAILSWFDHKACP